MTTEEMRELNKLAGTCGTRFVQRGGKLHTKHSLSWGNAYWLIGMLADSCGRDAVTWTKAGDNFNIHIDPKEI